MADPVAPVSPTGTPWLPPSAVKWVTLIYLIVVAVLGVLAAQFPAVPAYSLALQLFGAVGAILGLASPGLRSAAKILVVGFLAVSLSSCALFQKAVVLVPAEVQACGSTAVQVYQDVSAALELPTWEAKLVGIATSVPDGYKLVNCIVQTYLAWHAPATAAAAVAPRAMLATTPTTPVERAKAWLAMHP